jgi:chaperonin GroEL
MQAGFNKLVNVIRPTLGPLPHVVAIEKIAGRDKLPERLDSAGTIARRIVEIADRDQDVGLMFLRHVLWKLQEEEGDGTATAAVMFQKIYNLGRRYIVAGGNAMALRGHFEQGMKLLLNAIDRQVFQLQGKKQLGGLARSICYDDALAKMLGEIFDIIGPYGRLEVRQGSGHDLQREYVEGMYWDSGLRSREMGNADFGMRANLENPAILISDLEIEEPEQLIPLLNLAVRNNIKQILLLSATLSEKAMSILLTKQNQERVFVAAVKVPGMSIDVQRDAMEDLAVLTGGRPLMKVTGDTLNKVRLEDLGRARRAWADKEFFGIIGGRGNPREIRQHIGRLRQTYRAITNPLSPGMNTNDGTADRKRLMERLGKLTGGSATLLVGGISPSDIEDRVELAKRTAETMRGALREGVVLGGGVALLNCREVLRPCLNDAEDSDARAAYRILIEALETPFRVIAENAGVNPGKVLAEMEALGPDYGYDALARKTVSMRDAGIFDAAAALKGAIRSSVAGAALALTTEAIVHRRNPPEGIHT